MSTRGSLTRRGRIVVGTAVLLLLAGSVVIFTRMLSGPACTVTAGGRTVDLSSDQAEAVTTALAPQVRPSGPAAKTLVHRAAPGLAPDDAALVAKAVTGRLHAALSCRSGGAGTSEPDTLDSRGLTARAERVRQDVLKRFGDLPLGGYAPGGVHTGHMPGSAHYEGRAVDTFFRPITAANKNRGWQLAQYLVANASRLAIETVIFDDRIWTASRGRDGWRHYVVPDPQNAHNAAERAILEHRDHVHYDVTD
ncbi:hypothetical protein [Nocardioides marmorisolisilvae]|uniref:ARB-07466-like C-terminal domain-containing protein n=1 Tax=Nocardioides marmorisolisilvae TaxID=1542737 RepID=A0A3N0DIH4_9ACTN|nr:hypothetical protein [Nocardioides marmorisolisilvae]RNL75469.1 hypothetical protein EFL95_18860 [Nocardioides marmorisolisilvae]